MPIALTTNNLLQGHVVPGEDVVQRFFDAVEETDGLVGVHCTHGLNRTGYLICRFLIERKDWNPEEAIKAFDDARGHKQDRKNYLEDLKKRTPRTEEFGLQARLAKLDLNPEEK